MAAGEMVLACIGGSFAGELLEDGKLEGARLGTHRTPFGTSQPIYQCRLPAGPFYLLLRHSDGDVPIASSFANHRANIYALKELGATHIVSWSGARAVSHNYRVGQYVLPDDIIDETRHRVGTFFEHGVMLDLRQWPVFCPTLRGVLADVLDALGARHTKTGTYLCGEGPRRETRAEVRKYAQWGADLLGHSLAPEAFLAKELQLCYASVCFINDFAETGSIHRPFEAGGLFNNLNLQETDRRGKDALVRMPEILGALLEILPQRESICTCQASLADLINSGLLSRDFHEWFQALQPAQTPPEEKSANPLPLNLPAAPGPATGKRLQTH